MVGTLVVDGWAVYIWYREEGPTQSPQRCTKCNSPPINGQCTNFILFDVAVYLPLHSKGLGHSLACATAGREMRTVRDNSFAAKLAWNRRSIRRRWTRRCAMRLRSVFLSFVCLTVGLSVPVDHKPLKHEDEARSIRSAPIDGMTTRHVVKPEKLGRGSTTHRQPPYILWSRKKTWHWMFVHNAEKCRPILKFLSPLDSAVTLQQSFVFPTLALCALLNHIKSALENITIFSKISKYRKYTKYHDIFYIFDIFQKTKISSKLYNNGCNTLIQYSMTISYQSFVPYVKT